MHKTHLSIYKLARIYIHVGVAVFLATNLWQMQSNFIRLSGI